MCLLRVLVLVLACFVPVIAEQGVSEGQVPLDGRVHSADDGTPLPGARISLIGDGAEIASAHADRDGRFTIERPAGDYLVAISKAGFAPLQVSPGSVDSLVIALERGAVVHGRVVDEYGEPAFRAGVRVRPVDPSSVVSSGGDFSAITDDRGEYRIGSLPAGTYEVTLVSVVPSIALDLFAMLLPPRPAEPAIVALRPGDVRTLDFRYEPSEPPPPVAGVLARARLTSGETSGGTNSIRGRVVGPGGRPREGVLVVFGPASGAAAHTPPHRFAATDEDGRYEIRGLPPGRYVLGAVAPGFVSREDGATYTLRDDYHLQDIDLTLTRGSAIAGRVVDRYGEPLEGILVQSWSPAVTNGRATLTPGTSIQRTDDRGVFRLPGLVPGVYYLAALDDAGAWHAGNDELVMPDPREPALQPRVFYPGSTAVADALPIRVHAGLDASGTDLVFDPLPGSRVHGIAQDAAGLPLAGTVTLEVSARSRAPAVGALSATVAADGTFEFLRVPPGDYVMRAWMSAPFLLPEFGSRYVTVANRDEGPIVLQTLPTARFRGTVVLEQADVPAGFRPATGLRLRAAPADFDRSARTQRVVVGDDWRVTVSDLAGPARLVLEWAPSGWWLKTVTIDGVNAAEEPVDFAPGREYEGVRIVISGNGAALSGHALDERGERIDDYRVVVFAVDPRHWYDGSPRVKTGEPDWQGSFRVDALPPGEYLAAAVSGTFGLGLSSDSWSPEALTALAAAAERVRLREGQHVSLDLRVIRLPAP